MNDLEIRPAAADDFEALLALYRQLHPNDEPPPADHRLDDVWQTMQNWPGFTCLVATFEGTLVASCCLVIFPNLTHGGRSYAVIENVITHDAYRRRGIGRAIIDAALARAWDADCHQVMLLSSIAREGAHRFYEARGFRPDEKRGFIIRREPS